MKRSISFSVSDLVKSWGTSPVIKSEVSALLSAPQSGSVNPLVANDIKDLDAVAELQRAHPEKGLR